MKAKIVIALIILGLNSCSQKDSNMSNTAFEDAPAWAQEAIWYQIFVERFYNGNPDNDPDLHTTQGALIDDVPADWTVTSWTHDWYKEEDWAKKTGLDFYRTIQMRRYGGDLSGVISKLNYLADLGVNALYFNPLNDAPSLHKYDARNYHHIDVTFGNDKEGDLKLMAQEDPSNPSTWVWTNADKLFLEVIKGAHARGMKVILDYSWNHTGKEFWAFKDIIKNGASSKYKDWYEIKQIDNPTTPENEFDYEGWVGIKSLPELKKLKLTPKVQGEQYEGTLTDSVKQHIFDVCKKWMDPNGDGNITDGLDGMRLDVAEHVPIGFWQEFRKYTRSINPEFYLVGENWWHKWPDQLMDPAPWVKGDIFDAVMHYQWFKPARAYINQGDDAISLAEFYHEQEALMSKYKPSTQRAMMNLVSSHDTERALTSLANANAYKFHSKPAENKSYFTGKPSTNAYNKFMTLLLHQFTYLGAPHIWNGDEMGMWGADDPDNRKPLWWEEYQFDKEQPLYHEQPDYNDTPAFNKDIHAYYKQLCLLRKSNGVLSKGEVSFLREFEKENILAYTRKDGVNEMTILINTTHLLISINNTIKANYAQIVHKLKDVTIEGDKINFAPYSGIVVKN
jgi:cyclomaltodextrinase / maltogenic alpha-amylase / neopullulanase